MCNLFFMVNLSFSVLLKLGNTEGEREYLYLLHDSLCPGEQTNKQTTNDR
jgi:hypothetical protein